MTKRLGIFTFYEKNGIVEDYVVYLLQELKKAVQQLVFVCNGELSKEGRQRIVEFTDDIIIRDNRGFDAGAFKEVLLELIEKDTLPEYDEVVLCNDTFFGPFVPFTEIFADMSGRKLDFWGLSAQPKAVDFWIGSDDIVPAFIQSFFIVVGKQMFSDKRFADFWRGLAVDEWNRTQVVKNYEQRFTAYFESIGYRWGTYTDNSFFEGTPAQNNFTPYLMIPHALIKYGNCPFLKKKCITGKDIAQGMEPDNGSFGRALKYVTLHTEYDTDMILRYMINNCSKSLIADKLKISSTSFENEGNAAFTLEELQSAIRAQDDEPKISDMQMVRAAFEEGSITSLYRQKLFEFCKKQEKLYLYGTGGVATRTGYALMKNSIPFDGFVVSDGQNVERELIGHDVYYVSEVNLDNAGIVISVEERLYEVISKVLDDKGMKNYIYSCY